jgi:glutamate/tyrosine decarboxylase-like PLP-dependent enzyme
MTDNHAPVLRRAAELAIAFLDELPERPVGRPVDHAAIAAALERSLADDGADPLAVIEDMAADADPGIVAAVGPRYFGFVHGGAVPAGVAADWLATTWDNTAGMYIGSPAAAVIEQVAADWLRQLFGLSGHGRDISTGFTTGCNMANFTGLAAARHALLARHNWDVETQGLFGAPVLNVVVGAEAHGSIFAALQMLGLGRERVTRIEADDQGRMRVDALEAALDRLDGPTVVCVQAGNVNTGAFDPFVPIIEACHAGGAWVHVDGAFGLWVTATNEQRHLAEGVEKADSWAADAHKWLNVPYDSGIVMTAHRDAHEAAMTISGAYLVKNEDGDRDRSNWVPEASRRLRGAAIYATIRTLGRNGIAAMIEGCCRHARRLADRLGAEPGIEILNDVVINQVMVRFADPGDDSNAATNIFTRRVIAAVQRDGTCWMGETIWRNQVAMRVSVSNWRTSADDMERSIDAVLACYAAERKSS